jgi:hypothetical protein
LKKYLKYLISLFLVFGLTVNDCSLDSVSKSDEYYQFSGVTRRRELSFGGYKVFVFNWRNSTKKTLSPVQLAYLKLQDIYGIQVREIFKFRTLLYQEVRSILTQSIFLNEVITSKNPFKSLYMS